MHWRSSPSNANSRLLFLLPRPLSAKLRVFEELSSVKLGLVRSFLDSCSMSNTGVTHCRFLGVVPVPPNPPLRRPGRSRCEHSIMLRMQFGVPVAAFLICSIDLVLRIWASHFSSNSASFSTYEARYSSSH